MVTNAERQPVFYISWKKMPYILLMELRVLAMKPLQHLETHGFSRGSMASKLLEHGLPEKSSFHGAAGIRVLENVRKKICTNETVINYFLDENNADQYKKIAWLRDVLILILPPVAAGIATVFVVRDGLGWSFSAKDINRS